MVKVPLFQLRMCVNECGRAQIYKITTLDRAHNLLWTHIIVKLIDELVHQFPPVYTVLVSSRGHEHTHVLHIRTPPPEVK